MGAIHNVKEVAPIARVHLHLALERNHRVLGREADVDISHFFSEEFGYVSLAVLDATLLVGGLLVPRTRQRVKVVLRFLQERERLEGFLRLHLLFDFQRGHAVLGEAAVLPGHCELRFVLVKNHFVHLGGAINRLRH